MGTLERRRLPQDDYSARIHAQWHKCRDDVIELGRLLKEAKDAMPHGHFQIMIKRDLPFGPRWAQKLMKIARDPNITNAKWSSHLPIGANVLLRLTGLSEDEFEKRIREGRIHPEMEIDPGNDFWFTPEPIITAARDVLGEIDLDPTSCQLAQKIVQAKRYFTVEDNALTKEWDGRIWLNPPYDNKDYPIEWFVDYLLAEIDAKRVTAAIMLVNARTDTAWFHRAEAKAALICFTEGRIEFYDSRGSNGHGARMGQSLFYFGPHPDRFKQVFGRFGFVR